MLLASVKQCYSPGLSSLIEVGWIPHLHMHVKCAVYIFQHDVMVHHSLHFLLKQLPQSSNLGQSQFMLQGSYRKLFGDDTLLNNILWLENNFNVFASCGWWEVQIFVCACLMQMLTVGWCKHCSRWGRWLHEEHALSGIHTFFYKLSRLSMPEYFEWSVDQVNI